LKVKNYLFQAINRIIIETILNKGDCEGYLGFDETKVSRLYQGETCLTTGFEERV
jgi:hypothetical protein